LEDVRRTYENETGCVANNLQIELYECQQEDGRTVCEFINKLKEIKDKLIISGNQPSNSQMAFYFFNGLPKTAKWKTWTMITKGQFSSTVTNSTYIKLQLLLTIYEVEVMREKLIRLS